MIKVTTMILVYLQVGSSKKPLACFSHTDESFGNTVLWEILIDCRMNASKMMLDAITMAPDAAQGLIDISINIFKIQGTANSSGYDCGSSESQAKNLQARLAK